MRVEPPEPPGRYLTTREVARLLRVRERKIYDLAASGSIPCHRITGKLLFPRRELLAWVEGPAAAARPAVLAGSHDPLLEWAVRQSECGLATLCNGSLDGLDRFAGRQAAVTGLHLRDASGWNLAAVEARDLADAVLIAWAKRTRGLLFPESTPIRDFAALRGRRVAIRQPGSGAAVLFDRLLRAAEMSPDDIRMPAEYARSESDAAAAVAAGEADATLGLQAMADRFRLGFQPLMEEEFDLLVDRRAYFTEPVQRLLAFAGGPAFRERADRLGGYGLAETGSVRWLSP